MIEYCPSKCYNSLVRHILIKEDEKMKLNYKRVILVGFAFFLICAFWQAYDTIVPKILTDKFGMSQTASGVVMTLDNILALFMLPMFGAISDRCNSKKGKRTPFILVGTIVAVIAFVGMSFADNMQLTNISDVSEIDAQSTMTALYNYEYSDKLLTPDGEKFSVTEKFTEEEFLAITSEIIDENGEAVTNPDYTNYVVPARQAYAWGRVVANPTPLIVFIAVLLVALVAMATFRSPAVALMPDVVIKPLRSKANAVINLMGTAGGILVLILGTVFATGAVKNQLMSYIVFFGVIAAIMLVALAIFMLTVREPKWAAEMQADTEKYGIEDGGDESGEGDRRLSKGELASLIFILLSVFLWYMGYNAVTSKYSVYAGKVMELDYNTTLLLANAAAIVSYLPVGMIASKIGRKKSILAGVVMLGVAFGIAGTLTKDSPAMLMNCMFALAGIGWATINVNSFPMVVELAKGSTVGKYTGYYYAFSMAAQAITPTLSGMFMDNYGLKTLFPYATIFVALAFITMLFVRHGDNKPVAKKGIEALDVGD